MAAIVIGDHAFEPRAEVVHFQKHRPGTAKTPRRERIRISPHNDARSSPHRTRTEPRSSSASANTRRKCCFHGSRLIHEAGVESGLPATGLRLAKFDLASGPFQYLCHGHTHARKNLVDQTGHEDRNAMLHNIDVPFQEFDGLARHTDALAQIFGKRVRRRAGKSGARATRSCPGVSTSTVSACSAPTR